MIVKGEKRYWVIFLRTLAAFMALWLLMVWILTVNNRENLKKQLEKGFYQQAYWAVDDIQMVLDGAAPNDEKPAIMAWHLIRYFENFSLEIYRVYNEQKEEIARSPISMGAFGLPGSGTYDHYIMFDSVLTDDEQLEMAAMIRENRDGLSRFYGTEFGRFEDIYDQSSEPRENLMRFIEVTGIQKGNTIYPQKVAYHFEDRVVILMESDHVMFRNAELTTIQFEAGYLSSILAWGELSSEQLLQLYCQAQENLDNLMNELSVNTLTSSMKNGAKYTERLGVPIAYAYGYDSWQLATYDLGLVYTATFFAALLAAVWVNHIQIKSLKKERRFTCSVAHELKTPVAVLRAYAEALEEDAVPEKRQEYLTAIVEESDRMAVLVNELLALSRMEGSAMAIAEERVDLAALVLTRFERMSVPLYERALKVEIDLRPVVVKGDPDRLSQVINNLAVNVLCHAKPGLVRVTLVEREKRAVLTVENRCEPISEEKLRRLWDPFYKLDESRSGEGSGLGLAVVKNIVELHGGTCRAEWSNGSICFTVELPL